MKNLILPMLLALLCTTAYAQVPSYVDTSGLLAWYPLDSSLSNAYNGPMNGGVDYGALLYDTDKAGLPNHCYVGNGSNRIDIPINNFPLGNASRSVSVFYKSTFPYPTGIRELIAWGDNSALGNRFGIILTDSTIEMEYINGSVSIKVTPDDQWHNITVTYPIEGAGSASIKLYFDGVERPGIIKNPVSAFTTANSFIHTIGALFTGTYGWQGLIDNIGIWNRELSACEVQRLFYAGNLHPTVSVSGSTLTIPAVYLSYQWFTGSTTISGATSSAYTTTAPGSYKVVVVDSAGCSDTSAATTIGLIESVNPDYNSGDIVVFPNPSASFLNIRAPYEVNVVLTDMAGAVITTKNKATQVDIGGLANGIYFLSVYDKSGLKIKTERIVHLSNKL